MAAAETGTASQPHGLPRSSRPVGPEMLQRDDAIVREGRRITTRQLAFSLPISKGSVSHIILGLGRSRVYARRVPRSATVEKINFFRADGTFEAEGETFLSRIVTADETWVHYFESETKRQSKEWHRFPLPERKKFKTLRQRARSWSLSYGTVKINSCGSPERRDSQMRHLQQDADRIRKRFKRVQPQKCPREILIQRVSSRSHTSLKTREANTKFGWTVLPHPTYNPDIASSDFHLF